MDKKTLVTSVALSGFLCAMGCALAQIHHPNGRSPISGPVMAPLTPALKARQDEKGRLDQAARAALDAGDYAEEEADARQSLSLGIGSGLCQDLLAQALYSQGKDQEALQVYKAMADAGDVFPRNLVPYAVLLLKSGHWAEAVNAYNKTLPFLPNGRLAEASSRFSPDVPQPKQLAVALHVAQGLTDIGDAGWGTRSKNEEGMREFAQALKLQPNSALTNYYYGFGWQQLDLKSRARAVYAPQAKAALQKAATLGSGDVKKKAEEALRGR